MRRLASQTACLPTTVPLQGTPELQWEETAASRCPRPCFCDGLPQRRHRNGSYLSCPTNFAMWSPTAWRIRGAGWPGSQIAGIASLGGVARPRAARAPRAPQLLPAPGATTRISEPHRAPPLPAKGSGGAAGAAPPGAPEAAVGDGRTRPDPKGAFPGSGRPSRRAGGSMAPPPARRVPALVGVGVRRALKLRRDLVERAPVDLRVGRDLVHGCGV